jgi:hypothetical protein
MSSRLNASVEFDVFEITFCSHHHSSFACVLSVIRFETFTVNEIFSGYLPRHLVKTD